LKTNLFYPNKNDVPDIAEIGGKGFHLCQLGETARVPEWFALPVSVFHQCLEQHGVDGELEKILAKPTKSNIPKIADKARSLILSLKIPDSVIDEIENAVATLPRDTGVAVRSSAADEDGAKLSFAGIHESYMFLRGTDEIVNHIRKVWASGYQERAIIYRLENKLPTHPVPMAVIVQRMIDARRGGVVFTADPLTGNP